MNETIFSMTNSPVSFRLDWEIRSTNANLNITQIYYELHAVCQAPAKLRGYEFYSKGKKILAQDFDFTLTNNQRILYGNKNVEHSHPNGSGGNISFRFKTTIKNSSDTIPFDVTKNLTVPNIDRSTRVSLTGYFTLGKSLTFNFTPKVSNYKIRAYAELSDTKISMLEPTKTTSFTYTFPTAWAAYFPNQKTFPCTMVVVTEDTSGNQIDSIKISQTLTIKSKPTASLAITDTLGHIAKYGAYVAGQSKIKAKLTGTGFEGSTIKSYEIWYKYSYKKNEITFTPTWNDSGTIAILGTVVDSRGISSETDQKSYAMLEYTKPSINLRAYRVKDGGTTEAEDGNQIRVDLDARVTPLNSVNTATYKLYYKKTSATTWTSKTLTAINNNHALANYTDANLMFTADEESTYDVKLEVKDDFYTVSKGTSVMGITPIMHFRSDGDGIGFGKTAETPNGIDVAYKINPIGGFANQSLPMGTDLNDLTTPNIYLCTGTALSDIVHAPSTSAAFVLDVTNIGSNTGVRQTFTQLNKNNVRTWQRYYGSSEWGNWLPCFDEEGVINGWSYIKHKEGTVEFWCKKTVSGLSLTKASTGDFWYTSDATTAFPFTLTEAPSVALFTTGDRGLFVTVRDQTLTGSIKYCFNSLRDNITTSTSLAANIYIKGKWA